MKAKQKVSVGIDGITCVVSGVFVLDEIHYPRESLKPILKITPKNKSKRLIFGRVEEKAPATLQ